MSLGMPTVAIASLIWAIMKTRLPGHYEWRLGGEAWLGTRDPRKAWSAALASRRNRAEGTPSRSFEQAEPSRYQGRGLLGVIEGLPKGIEGEDDVAWRKICFGSSATSCEQRTLRSEGLLRPGLAVLTESAGP